MNFTQFFYSFATILNEMSPYILLGFIIAGILHVYVRPETMSHHLAGNGWKPVLKAALFGIPLPLCSCGVLPTAVSLRRQGASPAAATSFLIATPQTGVDSIAATYSLLGLPYAIIRPVAALAGALFGGLAVGKFAPEAGTQMPATESTACHCGDSHDSCAAGSNKSRRTGFLSRMAEAVRYGLVDMVASVGKWLVIGLIIAALITVFVPDSLFVSLNRYPLLAMVVMVIVAVPMYICATGSIPIALSLMLKGLSPGTAFVLLMAGPAANFASVMILSRTNGRRATTIYLGSVVFTAMAFGLLIDYILPVSWFAIDMGQGGMASGCHEHANVAFGAFETSCSILLSVLLAYAAVKRYFPNSNHIKSERHNMNTRDYKIKGMSCAHCQKSVHNAIAALHGVSAVSVDLNKGIATVEGDVSPSDVINAIETAGFEYSE